MHKVTYQDCNGQWHEFCADGLAINSSDGLLFLFGHEEDDPIVEAFLGLLNMECSAFRVKLVPLIMADGVLYTSNNFNPETFEPHLKMIRFTDESFANFPTSIKYMSLEEVLKDPTEKFKEKISKMTDVMQKKLDADDRSLWEREKQRIVVLESSGSDGNTLQKIFVRESLDDNVYLTAIDKFNLSDRDMKLLNRSIDSKRTKSSWYGMDKELTCYYDYYSVDEDSLLSINEFSILGLVEDGCVDADAIISVAKEEKPAVAIRCDGTVYLNEAVRKKTGIEFKK